MASYAERMKARLEAEKFNPADYSAKPDSLYIVKRYRTHKGEAFRFVDASKLYVHGDGSLHVTNAKFTRVKRIRWNAERLNPFAYVLTGERIPTGALVFFRDNTSAMPYAVARFCDDTNRLRDIERYATFKEAEQAYKTAIDIARIGEKP